MKSFTSNATFPIGKFDSDPILNEFEAVLKVFDRFEVDLILADAVTDEEEARQSVQRLTERNPDLLLLIYFRGLSVRAM